MNKAAIKQRILSLFKNKNISGSCKDVMMVLLGYVGKNGRAWPSHQTLADRTGWSLRSIVRAIQQGEAAGLIHKTARRAIKAGRMVRSSNLYTFLSGSDEALPERGMRFMMGRVARIFLSAKTASLGKSSIYNKAPRHESSLTQEQMIAYCLSVSGQQNSLTTTCKG